MSTFRNCTTDDLGRLCFLPAIPSFMDPDEEESFSVSYDSPKDYFCKWGPKVFRVEYYPEVIFQNY